MEKRLLELFTILENISVELPLYESSDITYYELRRLITIMYKMAKDKVTKNVLGDILKILTVLELKKQPVPTIQKLKSHSPKIFGD